MSDSSLLDHRARRWAATRTFSASGMPGARELAARAQSLGLTISVILPARNEESTVGVICERIRSSLMDEVALVDELLVIDGNSDDNTPSVARAAGAVVLLAASLLPAVSWIPGKGESLWRSLSGARGDLIVWIDADIQNFSEHFVTRLLTPLLMDDSIAFVKGYYRRPIRCGNVLLPSGGGRVTELLARPMLRTFFPELAGFRQPLAGEYAGRRSVLESVPFFSGYSVEAGLLVDLLERVGLPSMAQVDLTERIHRNRPLEDLVPMAHAIGNTIVRRAAQWGRLSTSIDHLPAPDEIERPPMALVRGERSA